MPSAFFSFHPPLSFCRRRTRRNYLSGQLSNPANRRHLGIDPSIGVCQSFSEFWTCCVGQSCASSIRESLCAKECTAFGKTRDLGSQPTSIKTVSLRRRPQII